MGNFLSRSLVAAMQKAFPAASGNHSTRHEDSVGSMFGPAGEEDLVNDVKETVRLRPDPTTYNQIYKHPVASVPRAFKMMYTGPAATVIVGPEKVQFSVQMSLLFHFSKMAERALNGHFKEAEGNTLTLPEVDADAFCFSLRYICRGQLGVYDYYRKPDDTFFDITVESSVEICAILCRLYVLVDYLDCPYRCPIQGEILHQRKHTIDEAGALDRPTPIIPSTLLYVSRSTVGGCSLSLFVIEDLRRELAKMFHRPLRDYDEWVHENWVVYREEVFEKLIGGFHWSTYAIGPQVETSLQEES